MVPEGWTSKAVGDVCNFINGNGFKSSEWADRGLPIIRIQNLNGASQYNYFDGEPKEKWIVNPGDILFAWAGTKGVSFGAKKWLGPRGVLNQHIFKVEPQIDLYKEWFYLALLRITQRVENKAHGFKSTLVHVQKSDITEQVLHVPPLPEQKKIAQILSTWDQAITATERLLENSQQRKKALMQQLLTGKKRLPGFEGEWSKTNLGSAGKISSAGVDKKIVDGEQKIRLLNFLDVFRREFIFDRELNHAVTAPDRKIANCNVQKGDVFFTPSSETRDEIGLSAVAVEDMPGVVYSYHIVRFRPNQPMDLNFSAYVFQTDEFRSQTYRLCDGSGQRYVLSQDGFRGVQFSIPTLDEQRAIGRVLKAASDEVSALSDRVKYLKQEKKALMQQLLTGKRRVKVDTEVA
ncbi:restriction endonuclease subunit S [Gilvimarinus sp. 2_MG-2023]|uniref:restriction endonuclease subunit S n=1 Tax=Gilvimarinus sp. 2_MG-2023 TaxID=3062666 RepID=UPI0026E20085|nr:restriction endonuclease subunit S [Gilvimarinus sp. 2_MG-2023]MDO6572353.1 restriction endonuclease subunit S [Gilvimarinus sp. 2_MG-2023]